MKPRTLNLALSGEPNLGSYIWGALDVLLADSRIEIAGISAAGIGAVCAAVLAANVARGRLQARQALAEFWYDVTHGGWPVPVVPRSRLGELDFDNVVSAYAAIAADPHEPLQALLQRLDFAALRDSRVPLFISATNVASGALRIFKNHELTPEVLLGTVAEPFSAPPVRIDQEVYWGGGFGGDPPLFPLVYESRSADILLVTRRRMQYPGLPAGSIETFERIWSLSKRQALNAELRAMETIRQLLVQGRLDAARYRPVRLHRVALDFEVEDTHIRQEQPEVALLLRGFGVSDVERWLAEHASDVGRRSSLDIRASLYAER